MARGDAPEDSYHLVGTSFFILGLGTLLPWNFFITAIPYFQARLAVVNVTGEPCDANITSPGDAFNFNNWMTLLSQLPLLLFTLLNSFFYQCWLFLSGTQLFLVMHSIPEMVRILGSLLGILMLFVLTAALVKVDMSPELFFSITMASIWFINCGVDAQTSALGYFITPCVGTLVSIACYLSLSHLEFARYYLDKKVSHPQAYELETRAELLQADEKNGFAGSPQKARLALEMEPEKEPKLEKASVLVVLRKIWVMALCIVLVFTVTLSVFPAITAMVTSSRGPGKWSQFFNPICCFLLFNTMDWLGRSMTSYFLWPDQDGRLLPLLACLRFLFVPLFMLCHVPERSHLPVLFPQDACFITFMLLFALSNGYLVSLTMCLAPRQVLPHESEAAGALMTFFLALGLSCGASLSFLFKSLL
ncbi:equilibrative nucleoside transporter 2 isoform X3 [Phascolarctos cinereus]|uniref:Equilibrative nucleoside transporter 2 isoform X3 n=1 Tax=Phascolarctos cinereus TaxID=38626 RepID=A0A6P5IPE4_PHACI|nr:equilibrative nucleoside transporter 2 isoform X3 [Phascolarctos cinereus]